MADPTTGTDERQPPRTARPRTGPVVRDRRRLDPETGQVRGGAPRRTRRAGARGGGRAPAGRARGRSRSGGATPSWRPPRRAWPTSGWPTCSGCRRSTSTTAAGSSATATWPVNAPSPACSRRCCPVLDDIHLARQHGDLESGPFAAIADKLEATLGRFGLARFGAAGEAFDPTVHEALMHTEAELGRGHHGDDRGPGAAAGLPAVEGSGERVPARGARGRGRPALIATRTDAERR